MTDLQPQIVVAGHICLDITPTFHPGSSGEASRLLAPGKLVHVGAADVHTGGCVANTGLALHHFGVPVRLVAKVGSDAFGELIHELLTADGAQCALSVDDNSSTSYSIVVAPPGTDRTFWHHPGANEAFSSRDVPDSVLQGAKWLHFGYPPLMTRMCENNGFELQSLLHRAQSGGLITSLDLSAVDPSSPAGRLDWLELLAAWLPHVDFFVPSAEELCFMLQPERYADWLQRANGGDVLDFVNLTEDVFPLAEKALGMGCKLVLIKCGARGMLYQSAITEHWQTLPLSLKLDEWVNAKGFQPSFVPSKVVSATGAGDTSIAAFLSSVLEGHSLASCVRRAAATGACCVETYDALSGLQPLTVVDKRIADGWATY